MRGEAMLHWRFENRSGPSPPGCRVFPNASVNVLAIDVVAPAARRSISNNSRNNRPSWRVVVPSPWEMFRSRVSTAVMSVGDNRPTLGHMVNHRDVFAVTGRDSEHIEMGITDSGQVVLESNQTVATFQLCIAQ